MRSCRPRVPERARHVERLDAPCRRPWVSHSAGRWTVAEREPGSPSARWLAWRGAATLKKGLGRWLQAAAAVLLFAAGMAVSQFHVDYADGRVVVSTGAATPAPNTRGASITLQPENMNPPERRIDPAEFDSRRVAAVDANAPAVDMEQLLQRVRAMIDQSEQRQQRELALRLSQVSREVDTQHQADLLKIQQDFGQQQEALEYLVRTSGGVK